MQRILHLLHLLKSQYLDKKSQEKNSFKNLKRIIYYCYNYNSFYRRKWKKAKFSPNKLKSLEDIRKIPITTKEEVINNIHEIMSKQAFSLFSMHENKIFNSFEIKINRYFFKRTSGTSGAILVLPIRDTVKKFLDAVYVRNLIMTGYTPKEKIILTTPKNTKYLNFYGFRSLYLNIFLPLEEQIKILEKETNFTLLSYPTFLFYIVQEKNRIRPNRIITTAETLSEYMRKKLEYYFNCEVFNMYGAAESGIIAGECKEKIGLHINIESIYVETIKNNEEVIEEPGEIIITPLRNFDLPLIRYKLGDIGVLSNERCSCGRSLPLLKKILGRANDFIVLRNHKLISPVVIDNLLAGICGIRLFRVIQKNLNECLVIYEGKKSAKKEIKENMKKITYNQIRIIVKRVKKLERQGHKHQTVISKLPFKGDENEIIY
jgi:phenylacetate-CoA ligase